MASSTKTTVFLNSLLVSGIAVFEKLFFFIVNIVIARYLSVVDFGEYTTALGVATFFSTFVNIGINQTLVRAINLDAPHEREHLGNTLLTKTLLSFLVFVIMSVSLFFMNYNTNTIYLVLIFGLVRIGNEYMTAFYALYEAKEKFTISSFFNFTFSTSILCTTFIVICFNGNYFHFAFMRLAIVIIILVILVFHTHRFFEIKFSRETTWSFLKNAVPFGLYSIFWYSLQRVNIIILSLIHGTKPVGYFNNAFIFLVTLTFIPMNLNKVLIPFLYKTSHTNNKGRYQFTFDIFSKYLGILSFYICIMTFMFAGKIIVVLFGDKYLPSIPILKIVSFAIPFLFNIAATIITAIDRQRINTKILGVGMLINIVLNLVLIIPYQAAGAAFAAVATFVIIFLITHYYIWKTNIVSIRKSFFMYIHLIIASSIIMFIHFTWLVNIDWIIAAGIDSIAYIMLIAIFLIRKNDLRIIAETLFTKNTHNINA